LSKLFHLSLRNKYLIFFRDQHLPTHTHESIVGHLHSRSTIESVRAILIRELYERTNDPHTEWLKCKMEIGRDFINPKYYADFQRRYRKDIKKNTMKKNNSISIKNKIDNGYHVFDITTTDETITTTQMDSSLENSKNSWRAYNRSDLNKIFLCFLCPA
jgi:hypothetical protein